MVDDNRHSLPSIDPEELVPGLSVDCVIIGFDKEGLKILAVKSKIIDLWALPGGFVFKDEDLDQAAIRVLKERTSIELPFLEQFKTFGDVDRRKKGIEIPDISKLIPPGPIVNWLKQRFVSTGYVSLVNMDNCDPTPDLLSDAISWHRLRDLPELMIDHPEMVREAIAYIRNQINFLPIGRSLLPDKFTMKELQHLYESILEKKLDRGNFQRKMLKLNFLKRHEKQLEGGAHKAPYLYSFDDEKYEELLKSGIGFVS